MQTVGTRGGNRHPARREAILLAGCITDMMENINMNNKNIDNKNMDNKNKEDLDDLALDKEDHSRTVSVIVFSKGRPMQLHAYLESLLRFSDIGQEQVTVLCCETKGIRYGRVRKSFPGVSWQTEKNFEQDLKDAVAKADAYIMFGCDDVVFTHPFRLEKAASYLSGHEDVFGFSIRLGQNIAPFPQDAVYHDGIMEWDWEDAKEQHYNYPWELDCTVYRKADVERLIAEEEKAIKNPNYFEAVINDDNKSLKLERKHMACNKARGCAVVITVNRVQDSYQNGFDDSMMTDIYSLDRLYNDEGNTLDIEKISRMENRVVHVGAEYFLLRKDRKGYSANRLWKKKVKNLGKSAVKFPKKCYHYVERRLYRHGMFERKLSIINTEKTLVKLAGTDKSFVRFGENEILLMQGKTVPSQHYDAALARRLKKLLLAEEEGLLVGIPYFYVYPREKLTPYMEVRSLSVAEQRRFLFRHCRKAASYIDSGFTQAYHLYEDYDFEHHFRRARKLFADKDVTVICGEGVFDRFSYRLLDACRSVQYQYAPGTDAFASYKEIVQKALKIDKNRLVCVALGPTAAPLVHDLHKRGYQAWDIGHLLKDYDTWKKRKPRTQAETIQFYMPD